MQRLRCLNPGVYQMKTKFVLVACLAAFACACQQKQSDAKMDNGNGNGQKMMDDQNFQDRRKDMQQPQKRSSCGSCEAEKVEKVEAPAQSATVSTPEVKVEKAQ